MNKKSKLSREVIVQSALKIADERGIKALSMRNVAHELGVEAMSLYNHVKNKEDILDGLVELVALEIELPGIEEGWKEALYKRTASAYNVLLKHPWSVTLFVSRTNIGPVMLRYTDSTLGYLHRGGFSPELSDYAWNSIDSYLYGFLQQVFNFPFETSEFQSKAEEFMPELSSDTYPYLYSLAQQVSNGTHDGIPDFDFGLNLILDGLEKLIEEQKAKK